MGTCWGPQCMRKLYPSDHAQERTAVEEPREFQPQNLYTLSRSEGGYKPQFEGLSSELRWGVGCPPLSSSSALAERSNGNVYPKAETTNLIYKEIYQPPWRQHGIPVWVLRV